MLPVAGPLVAGPVRSTVVGPRGRAGRGSSHAGPHAGGARGRVHGTRCGPGSQSGSAASHRHTGTRRGWPRTARAFENGLAGRWGRQRCARRRRGGPRRRLAELTELGGQIRSGRHHRPNRRLSCQRSGGRRSRLPGRGMRPERRTSPGPRRSCSHRPARGSTRRHSSGQRRPRTRGRLSWWRGNRDRFCMLRGQAGRGHRLHRLGAGGYGGTSRLRDGRRQRRHQRRCSQQRLQGVRMAGRLGGGHGLPCRVNEGPFRGRRGSGLPILAGGASAVLEMPSYFLCNLVIQGAGVRFFVGDSEAGEKL